MNSTGPSGPSRTWPAPVDAVSANSRTVPAAVRGLLMGLVPLLGVIVWTAGSLVVVYE